MFLNKSRCYNGGGKHNFSPRYNVVPNRTKVDLKGHLLPEEVRSLMYYKEYLFD